MSIIDYIGNTPLVEIKSIWKSDKVRIFAKVEGCNPGGSIKDRVALNMIRQAIHREELKRGQTVIEATSGNTGIGLAMVCAALKYRCILVMPENVSEERVKICNAFGAKTIAVKGNTDAAISHVKSFMVFDNYYNPNQFDNPDNWKTHFLHTGREITYQLQELLPWTGYAQPNPTVFVASCGTTGTLMGCKAWFDYNKKITENYYPQEYYEALDTKTVAVFPKKHSNIQGLKNLRFNRKPKIYNKKLIDKRVIANDGDAFNMMHRLAKEEGIFCGISSGAAMHTAIKEAEKMKEGCIVVILPDNGYRYLSEGVF